MNASAAESGIAPSEMGRNLSGRGILAVAAVYFGLAALGLEFVTVAEHVTLVWAPAGFGLAAVLLWGPRAAVGIALALLALGPWSGSRTRAELRTGSR